MLKISRVFLISLLTSVFFAVVPVTAMAAQGRILDRIEAEQADSAALAAETGIFKSIGLSIALSIAQCNAQPDCVPVVDKAELETLLDKLDERINKLVIKQEAGETDYTELLTAYVTQRENYLKYQEQLEALSAPEEVVAEPVEEEPFAGEEPAATTTGVTPPKEEVDLSIFEDVGDELGAEPGADESGDVFTDEPLPEE